jgi:hypothetical protein
MNLDELNRLCAEKIMGWLWSEKYQGYEYHPKGGNPVPPRNWQPTRNISQAWEVLEKVKGHDWDIHIEFLHYAKAWVCSWRNKNRNHAFTLSDISAPLCIILACLKAKGVEVE